MKLLLYSWKANNEQILADNLSKMGFEVLWFCKECRHYTRDMELAMEMIPFIHSREVEAVVSFNYFPIVSMICSTCRIPYYAWVYDCPHFTLYAKQITLPCNHIGIFDREMVRRLEDYGVETVYDVPLSVDAAYFAGRIMEAEPAEKKKYQCDISFVGSLYTGEYDYYEKLFAGSEPSAVAFGTSQGRETERISSFTEIRAAIERQCFSYRRDHLRQSVIEGRIDLNGIRKHMEEQGLMLGEDYFASPEDILLAAVLEKRVTVEERSILLTDAAKRFAHGFKTEQNGIGVGRTDRGFDFRLYTGSDTKGLPELAVLNRGTVDYHTQMPLVFAGSRINLNISLRSIHSGIPLRVLDIMACGGFVLSNWQPEIAACFAEGVEIVTFDSLEDCLAKTAYYLSHEEERRQIAANGQKKVQEKFSYQIGLDRLFG